MLDGQCNFSTFLFDKQCSFLTLLLVNTIQTFDFGDQPIRIINQNNQPWFVAADVCRTLEIGNSRQAISELDDDEKDQVSRANVSSADISVPNRGLNLISESGLYALIFKSRKPEAKTFRKWVTSEVLPSLRQSGSYTLAPSSRIPKIQEILEETIIAVHEGRCPINKAIAISTLSAQYIRSQLLTLPLKSDQLLSA